MNESRRVVAFSGPVRCMRDDVPRAVTLGGSTAQPSGAEVTLTFSFAPHQSPPRIPDALYDVLVDEVPAGDAASRFRLCSGQDQWEFPALACHLHREVAKSFYRAIPQRAAPWSRRMFWRLMLALAARPLGKRMLLALRGR